MLNDTSVASAHACILLHIFDVIPLDITAHERMSAYTHITHSSHRLHIKDLHMGGWRGKYTRTLLNVQANFLCLQLMTTVNHILIITKRQTGSSHLPKSDQLKASTLRSLRAIRWPALVECLQFMMV